MGEAKRRKEQAVPMVYHHTSTLRTNLIWMSGVIELEGRGLTPIHPKLGEIKMDAKMRRGFTDFAPLAWFTTRVDVPQCIMGADTYAQDKTTGELKQLDLGKGVANAIALNRVALGFRLEDIPVIKWSDHPGYATAEGQELNASAAEVGDDPADWYVADEPVDVMTISEFWASRTIMEPKLRREPNYVSHIKRMVEMCRTQEGVFIPPTWMKPEEARKLATRLNLPVS